MKNNKMYNVMFPIWILFILPITWIIIIPANFLIDTIVLLIALKLLKVQKISKVYKSSILKIWIFGFIADIIGSIALLLTQLLPESLYSSITKPVALNPFTSIWAVIIVLIAIFISGFIIYVLNSRFTFNKTKLSKKRIVQISLIFAVITAPWALLYPTEYLYKAEEKIEQVSSYSSQDEAVSEVKDVLNNLECSSYMNNGVLNEKEIMISLNCTDENKVDEYTKKFKSASTNENLDKSADEIFDKLVYIENITFNVYDYKTFKFKRGE